MAKLYDYISFSNEMINCSYLLFKQKIGVSFSESVPSYTSVSVRHFFNVITTQMVSRMPVLGSAMGTLRHHLYVNCMRRVQRQKKFGEFDQYKLEANKVKKTSTVRGRGEVVV